MAKSVLYIVFLLPVLFSIIFGTVVMADILQKPDRELNMWRFEENSNQHDVQSIEIIGLQEQYSASQPISFDVKIHDLEFSCGDLYITIYSNDEHVIAQNGFFNQCFSQNNPVLPTDSKFSELVDIPGTYKAVIELTDKDQKNTLVTSEKFTVK